MNKINKYIFTAIFIMLIFSTIYHTYYTIYWLSSKKNDLQNIEVNFVQKEINKKNEAIYEKKIDDCFSYLKKVDEKRRIYHILWVKTEIKYYSVISIISFILTILIQRIKKQKALK